MTKLKSNTTRATALFSFTGVDPLHGVRVRGAYLE